MFLLKLIKEEKRREILYLDIMKKKTLLFCAGQCVFKQT